MAKVSITKSIKLNIEVSEKEFLIILENLQNGYWNNNMSSTDFNTLTSILEVFEEIEENL